MRFIESNRNELLLNSDPESRPLCETQSPAASYPHRNVNQPEGQSNMAHDSDYVDVGAVVTSSTDPAAFGARAQKEVLETQVRQLLGANAQADRIVRNKGAFTPAEAATLKQAASLGLLTGLVKVEIEDPYSHSRRIEFYGDDEGATWHQFANPLRIGKFATPDKQMMAAEAAARRGWWQA
jgi:hypothetical protein